MFSDYHFAKIRDTNVLIRSWARHADLFESCRGSDDVLETLRSHGFTNNSKDTLPRRHTFARLIFTLVPFGPDTHGL